MGFYHLPKPTSSLVRLLAPAFVGMLLALALGSTALATSYGVISGKVTDATTTAPVSDVAVSAVSPTGNYKATTDARGFYSMSGVFADTYSVTFSRAGYQLRTEVGINVFADQVSTLDVTLTKSPTTLGKVVVHGQASAYQPTLTTTTTTIDATQIQNLQGSNFNGSETNLITSLPGAMADSSGYPVIHGGREYEEGFEFEGIPYTDPYTNQFNNSLGIPTAGVQLVQLTTGTGDPSQAGGGVGMFNVVAKRGTYPGYVQTGVAVGGPDYDHRLNLDASWATPNGHVSNYISFTGDGFSPRFGNGTTPLVQLNQFYGLGFESDREALDNFVYRFGNNNSQSVQLFGDFAQHDFFQNAGGLTGLCFASCDPVYDGTWGGIFGFSAQQMQAISALYPEQTSPSELLISANRSPATYWQPNSAMKVEYTNNLSQSTYFSLKWYRTTSVVTFDFPGSRGSFDGDSYLLQGGQTTGGTFSIQSQLNDKNLVEFGTDYSFLHPIDSYLSDSFGLYGAFLGIFSGAPDLTYTPYAFISPTDPNCPNNPPFGLGCGYAYGFPNAPKQLTYPQFNQISTVNRQDYSLFLDDKVDVSNHFKAEVGARLDMATYRMPTPGVDPTFCTTLYFPTTWTPNPNYISKNGPGPGNCPFTATYNFTNDQTRPHILQPRVGLSYQIAPNSAVRLTYDRAVQFVPIASVDFGEIDPHYYENQPYSNLPAVNLSGGPGTNCGYFASIGINSLLIPCRTFGQQLFWAAQNFDGIAYQPALPMTSDNYQINFQTQFTNGFLNGVAVSIAPWYRFQHNTSANEAAPVIGPNGLPEVVNGSIITYPPVLKTNGKEFATGIDLNITRQIAYGISGQFVASYINEFSSVIPTSSLEDFYPNIPPASLLAGNEYRVGFVSPLQTTLGLTYKTRTGWRINPRLYWNDGYPLSLGNLTAALVNGVALNVPNTNGVVGSAPNGPACYVDPMNPGSVFNPNIAACHGNKEVPSPGGVLGPSQTSAALTIEYATPRSGLLYGVNVDNLLDTQYGGPSFSARYQPLATGISGPLTGWSTNGTNYTNYPSAWPMYAGFIHGKEVFVNIPNSSPRTYYFYVQSRLP